MNPINYKHTEYCIEYTLPGHIPTVERSDNKIQYKPDSFFDSIKNFFNIRLIISAARALLASLFAPSHEAKEIRGRLTLITKSDAAIDRVNTAAAELLQNLRSKPADISIAAAHKLREDSVLALFNKGSFQTIVENYADWETEGTAKEGEVWQRAYDKLRENLEGYMPGLMFINAFKALHPREGEPTLFDYEGAAALFSKAPTRYEAKDILPQRLHICGLIIQSNFYKSVKTLDKAISETADPAVENKLSIIKNNLMMTYQNRSKENLESPEKMQALWSDLKDIVQGTPAENIMKQGYIQFS